MASGIFRATINLSGQQDNTRVRRYVAKLCKTLQNFDRIDLNFPDRGIEYHTSAVECVRRAFSVRAAARPNGDRFARRRSLSAPSRPKDPPESPDRTRRRSYPPRRIRIVACAAASRAIGTRNGEHET
jgi:hypothetical protein